MELWIYTFATAVSPCRAFRSSQRMACKPSSDPRFTLDTRSDEELIHTRQRHDTEIVANVQSHAQY